MCTPPQLALNPQGSRVYRPPPQNLCATPPAPAPAPAPSSAARQRRRQQRAPLRRTAWLLRRWRGVRRRIWKTHREAAGERSPRWRKGRRERREKVNLREGTRTLMTATTIQSSSRQRGSEDRDRGLSDKLVILPPSWANDRLLDKSVTVKGWAF